MPRETSITRHAPKQRRRNLEAEKPQVPDLPVANPLPATVAWWEAWLNSPQVSFFTATDWQTLVRLAPLVDLYWQDPKPQIAAEIRQTEAKLGATAADRDRLGWKVEEPSRPSEEPKRSRRPDPRLNRT